MEKTKRYTVIVIGGGQAGLCTGYYLAQAGISFLILDAGECIGDTWRKRWDSLRLFSYGRFNALPGLPFPASKYHFPTKDEMADYLEQYAKHFQLPVKLRSKVDALRREGKTYKIKCGEEFYEADHVVVAMSNYQYPKIPPFASELDATVVQLHSSAYENSLQLQPGPVLIVGAGNSGAEIALDVCNRHIVLLAGRDTGHVPFNIDNRNVQRFIIPIVFRLIFHRLLTTSTIIGRKVKPKVVSMGAPLIRQKPGNLLRAGIKRLPRLKGIKDGRPELENGEVLDVKNVIWCTGFHPGFSWIHFPIFKDGEPLHERGVVSNEPGLYFVGLHFLFAFSSPMIQGVGRDAKYVVEFIRRRVMMPHSAPQSRGIADTTSRPIYEPGS
ncbi:flavin-containing monooxygenase [Puia dinghuensis]|uniref:Oxidoreductase n=1 Tax=Puia dinghuensis TaxID=1792502 RepID=A0A8J2UBY8_9BACT|nr:NAD(P)-binding domain-containing protein [Puia dinghuensis]GGA96279.1 oxidoreductase [Puia dinghuensis]